MNLRHADHCSRPSGRWPEAKVAKEKAMSELVCIAFRDPNTADLALNKLQALQKEYLVELEDACVVVRDESGKIHLKQAVQLVKPAALGGAGFGALWGTMIGLLFLNPLAGLVVGAGIGAGTAAISASLTDYGISDDFIRQLGSTIAPDSSALFVLLRKINADKVLPELAEFQGRVLKTSLSDADEQRLRSALSEAHEKAA
jgi:uncharacterized membrane protein